MACACHAAWAKNFVIHAGTLIDGVAETPRHQVSIIVRDDKIVSVKVMMRPLKGLQAIMPKMAELLQHA